MRYLCIHVSHTCTFYSYGKQLKQKLSYLLLNDKLYATYIALPLRLKLFLPSCRVARFFKTKLTKMKKNRIISDKFDIKCIFELLVINKKYTITLFQKISKAWPLKIYQIWYFWLETIPSGNPAFVSRKPCPRRNAAFREIYVFVGKQIVSLSFVELIGSGPGLPDFCWYMIPNSENMYQINTKCTKWS
jgi:hypothetical protein